MFKERTRWLVLCHIQSIAHAFPLPTCPQPLLSFLPMATPSDLLIRAVSDVIPRKLAEEKLRSGKKLRLYFGIDPTGNKLHIGHAVPLRKLKQFKDAGHEVILLIGSFTAMIGDPTGQDLMRKALTKKDVEQNFKTYQKQAAKVLDLKGVEIRYNHEWLEKMSFAEIMGLAQHFTVQQMLQRDMFRMRMSYKTTCPHCQVVFPVARSTDVAFEELKKSGATTACPACKKTFDLTASNLIEEEPVSPNEFLYPLMQGYDSVVLDVDFEIGGNDQMFNMLCGRKLQKAFGKREKAVLTTKLIEGIDGRKMSKTYNNCIYLDDEPNDMYGKVMRVKDELMPTYFECCTDVPMEEAKEILKGKPRDAKARLAREIVALYHGEKAAKSAAEEFDSVFKEGGLPEDMPEVKGKKGMVLLDVLLKEKLIASKSEGRRLIEQGGIKLNNKVVQSLEAPAEEGVVTVGKRKFLRIICENT